MAIYHCSVKIISRATGRSAVAAAAYRASERLYDERLERAHDFTSKSGVVHSEVFLPEGAPDWMADRERLWNGVEAGEKRKDAQLAREVEFALPRELSQEQAIDLARDFTQEEFVQKGMVADLNVHWDMGADGLAKPHAHVMLTMRQVDSEEFGEAGFGPKVREWNGREQLQEWREAWEVTANRHLAEAGIDLRIDHRSLEAQGIELEPQSKIGPAGMRRLERGEEADRALEHEAIARENGERIAEDPTIALDGLTHQQSTFTKRDLARFVDRHTADAEQFGEVLAKVEASEEIVPLGLDGHGQERFTTREMIALEERMAENAEALSQELGHGVKARALGRALDGSHLSEEQVAAVEHVTGREGLSAVVGYAGTGKSTMLGVAREAWEDSGYQVRGATLSGIAAEGLQAGSGIESRTVASLTYQWGQGRELLGSRDVLVVDEAGMLGSRQMDRLMGAAREAGAKVVLVGDVEQLQAIEAGAAFRAITERQGAVEITEVHRQHEDWQRQATRDLATGRTERALEAYEAAGHVHGFETKDDAKDALIEGWSAARDANPHESQVILSYTRADVRDLNERARAVLQAKGELGVDRELTTERGARNFAEGDRVMFLKNERGLGVKNGSLATVEQIEASSGGGASLSVRLDGGRQVAFDLKDYGHIDHGYAATVHKAQGVTVDRSHVLATEYMDRHAAYVGLSRHRESVELTWSKDTIESREQLTRVLGRERAKDITLDYAERRGIMRDSEIAAEGRITEVPTVAEKELGRDIFAGLDLSNTAGAREIAQAKEEGRFASVRFEPQVPKVAVRDTALSVEAGGYAEAWKEAKAFRQEGLPLLAHQKEALEGHEAALERLQPGASADLRTALERNPLLAEQASTTEGRLELVQGLNVEREVRLDPMKRAERVVEVWNGLEKNLAEAKENYAFGRVRQLEKAMDGLGEKVMKDTAVKEVLMSQGRSLGISRQSELMQLTRGLSLGRDRELEL